MVQQRILCPEGIQEQVGQGGGRLHRRIRHHIRNMDITVVADGGNHGNGAGGNGDGQFVIVETGQVQFGSAAAEDEDGIVLLPTCLQKGRYDGSRCLFPLHERFQQIQTENIPIGIIQKMVPEIAVPGSGFGCNDSQAIRYLGKRQFLLHFHVPAGGEPFNGALAFQCLFTQGEGGVDIVDEKRNAVEFTETDLHPHQNGDTCLEGLSRLFFKEGFKGGIIPFPDHRPGLGDRTPAPGLCQGEITMAIAAGAPGSDFRFNPISPREGLRHPLLDVELQFQQVHVIPHFHKFTNIQIFPEFGDRLSAGLEHFCNHLNFNTL